MTERLIEQFNTRNDNGDLVRLSVYQQVIDAGHYKDPHATIPGVKRIVTEDGEHVNFVDDETFTVVSTGETLKR